MYTNIVEPDRPHITIRRMRTVWWVYKATNTRAHTHTHTHTEYVIFTAFPIQQWLRERALIFVSIACLVTFKSCSIRNLSALHLMVSLQLSTRLIWLRLGTNYRLLWTPR
jgi:hypothetical protein